ncbi:MAG: GNAT family N-acetyltransferase [Anaerolineae bacterium]|nr:GNAT family N-acetyltransferase [Anaerolineae bacterium]
MPVLPDELREFPPYRTRVMTPADLKAVAQIDRDAFELYRRQQRRLVRPLRLRTPENLNAAVRRPYPGVVVESPPGYVVGYCFTHVWGVLGWLGTLGVAPASQGLGLGRAVTAAGLELLRQAGCQTLALETMPESGKNIALYTRLGLALRTLTCLLQGEVLAASSTHFEVWSGGGALREVAGRLAPGLDPTPAARWLDDEEAGRTLIWREDGQAVAFAVLRHKPRRLEGMQTHLTVEAAACLPGAVEHWPRYLSEMQLYAERLGQMGLVLPVNGQQSALLEWALAAGLRIVHTRVRMVSGHDLGGADDLLMLTLAM